MVVSVVIKKNLSREINYIPQEARVPEHELSAGGIGDEVLDIYCIAEMLAGVQGDIIELDHASAFLEPGLHNAEPKERIHEPGPQCFLKPHRLIRTVEL